MKVMAETLKKHRDRPRVSETRQERDIKIYESHMRGNSIRAIQEEFQIKSTKTVWSAVNRGKELVIERGIDIEERRIDIDRMFKDTLGYLAQTIRHQVEHGQEEFYVDQDGRKSMKRRVGVAPRIAGELSRSLNRWAEFCGLLDRAPEVNQAATTLIQLSAPADGASFGDRWNGGETVDVKAENGPSGHESGHTAPQIPAEASTGKQGPTVKGAVEGSNQVQGELL